MAHNHNKDAQHKFSRNLLKPSLIALAISSSFALPALAQKAIADALARSAATSLRNLAESAEKMPEADYSFQATKETRTFAGFVGHTINSAYNSCSRAKGEANPNKEDFEKTPPAKAQLVAAVVPGGGVLLTVAFRHYSGIADATPQRRTEGRGHRCTSRARPTESASSASCSGSIPSSRLTIGSGMYVTSGSSRRDWRDRSMSRHTRATTVVSHPPRFSMPLASERVRWIQDSCTASSASLSEPSMR